MSSLADVREALALLLENIPAVKRVERYERGDIGTNNLPAASLWLVSVGRPGHDTSEELPSFGVNDYAAVWRINVRLGAPAPLYEVTAQQLFETIFSGVAAQLASTGGRLLADSTNTVFHSLATNGDILVPQDATDPFIAQFTLTTITVT